MNRPAISPVWYILAGIVSVQVGAAFAKTVFGEIEPVTIAWLRLLCAGLIVALLRPNFRGLCRKDWMIGLALAACLIGMNVAIYESIARIPLGLAVTIEFVGPLAISLTGCRRFSDLIWVALAASGVTVLGFGPVSHDLLGIAFAVLAGACWAGYIWFGALLSPSWNQISVLALTFWIGSAVLAAPAIVASGPAVFDWRILGIGFAVGLLSSVIPYTLELRALRLVETRVFGILMALEPVAAALAGIVVLNEWLELSEWVGVACIVIAAIGAVRSKSLAPAARVE